MLKVIGRGLRELPEFKVPPPSADIELCLSVLKRLDAREMRGHVRLVEPVGPGPISRRRGSD